MKFIMAPTPVIPTPLRPFRISSSLFTSTISLVVGAEDQDSRMMGLRPTKGGREGEGLEMYNHLSCQPFKEVLNGRPMYLDDRPVRSWRLAPPTTLPLLILRLNRWRKKLKWGATPR